MAIRQSHFYRCTGTRRARIVQRFLAGLLVIAALLGLPRALHAQLTISEFLASNVSGLRDDLSEQEDWIEIDNSSGATVSLSGWYLTDDKTRLRKWPFPAWTLGTGKKLVVFASNRDLRPAQAVAGQDNTGTAAQPRLATNFKISSNAGRYLALTREAGGGVVVEAMKFDGYPRQIPDVSYGPSLTTMPLVTAGSGVRALVPTASNGGNLLGETWRGGSVPFDDSAWISGTQGVGMSNPATPVSSGNLKLRLKADTAEALVTDSSGLGHHAVNTGGSTIFMPAATDTQTASLLRRGALQFDQASSSRITLPAAAHTDFNSASGTIMMWIKAPPVSGPGTVGSTLWDRRSASSGAVLALTNTTTNVANPGRLFIQPAVVSSPLYSTVRIDDNQWHHIAFVYNQAAGATDRFYIDGVARGSASHTSAWSWPADQQVEMGTSQDSTWHRYHGLMDEVRFYNTALSAGQITAIFNGADEGVDSVDIGTSLAATLPGNAGAFIRIPFTVSNPASILSLRLTLRGNDGAIAWLNGSPAASFNAPASPVWNSLATTTALPGRQNIATIQPGSIVSGTNILAVQALNNSTSDVNCLALATLDAVIADNVGNYLLSPTPGAANSGIRTNIGPYITDVTYDAGLELPPRPAGGLGSAPITIRARVVPGLQPLSGSVPVRVAWRILYGAETLVTMTPAGGGFYIAAIPTTALTAGQMIRWRIIATDTAGTTGTAPAFLRPTDSDQYFGTVAADTVATQLPLYHIFVPGTYTFNNSHEIDRDNVGGRASLFYDGELYDNVYIRIKGDTTRTLFKRAHRVDFNSDHQFRWAPGRSRMKELALNSEYVDPSYSRQMLALWLHRVSGTSAPEHFPVRCHINGAFWQLAFHTETQDFELLENMDLDPNGALYISVGQMDRAGGEKQTRVTEDTSDMAAFVTAVTSANATTRKNNVFDQVDIPAVINYSAVARLTQEGDDTWANMSIHRDSDGTGEWRNIPFDTNLSWGQLHYAGNPAGNYVIHAANDRSKSHPFSGSISCKALDYPGAASLYNRFFDAIISVPETRTMYLRRLRSIMDQYLQAPGTANPMLEAMIDAHVARITQEANLDRSVWGWPPVERMYGLGNQPFNDGTASSAIPQLKNLFIAPRRTHLFVTHTSMANVGITNTNSAGIPAAPQPASFPITIAGYDHFPAGSATQDEEYVQLTNPNSFAADISGWSLTGAVGFTFKGGTVINAGSSLYVSPRQAAFRARSVSPRGGEGRFVVGPYSGQISSRGETLELRDAAGVLVTSVATAAAPTPAQMALRITELNYHPSDPSPAEIAAISSVVSDDFEYIELLNTGTSALNLAGARFTKGIDFTFPAGTTLAAGARLLVVANVPAFQLRHGTVPPVTGPYLGSLDNGGEELEIVDASGEVVLDFRYEDTWHPPTDGGGRTLVVRDADPADTGYGQPSHWAISSTAEGSPGTGDTAFGVHYSSWRWDHFTLAEATLPDGSENSALTGPLADPDGDGLNNFGEYAFGTDPGTPRGSIPSGIGFFTEGGQTYATVNFRRLTAAMDAQYSAEFSSDLQNWTVNPLPAGAPADPANGMESVTFRDPVPSGPKRYIRIRAQRSN